MTDPSGAVLASVKVTLTNEATGVSREATTNDSGDYVFVEVQPGHYQLEFEQTGFKKNVQQGCDCRAEPGRDAEHDPADRRRRRRSSK